VICTGCVQAGCGVWCVALLCDNVGMRVYRVCAGARVCRRNGVRAERSVEAGARVRDSCLSMCENEFVSQALLLTDGVASYTIDVLDVVAAMAGRCTHCVCACSCARVHRDCVRVGVLMRTASSVCVRSCSISVRASRITSPRCAPLCMRARARVCVCVLCVHVTTAPRTGDRARGPRRRRVRSRQRVARRQGARGVVRGVVCARGCPPVYAQSRTRHAHDRSSVTCGVSCSRRSATRRSCSTTCLSGMMCCDRCSY
jgi:hypothetical protein